MRFQWLISSLALCSILTVVLTQEEKSALKVLTSKSDKFLINLYKEIANSRSKQNLISSPLSAHVVLSMTAYGAAGESSNLMRDALNLPVNDSLAFKGFQELTADLTNVQNATLDVANKIYVNKVALVKTEYLNLTNNVFNAKADSFDTKNPFAAAKNINDWVSNATHNKLSNLIDSSSITEDTRLILLNAIYFKAEWAKAFNVHQTRKLPFYLRRNKKVSVDTMSVRGYFTCGRFPNLNATYVEIPYKNKDLSMVVIVPDKPSGLHKIENNLELFNLSIRTQIALQQDIKLRLPKFKIESTIDLNEPLEELNLENIFSGAANSTGISDEPLKVDQVKQKAFIEVTEQGTEAAAATEVVIMAKASFDFEPIEFNIDRPFYFMINKGQTTLFQGHVYNPLS